MNNDFSLFFYNHFHNMKRQEIEKFKGKIDFGIITIREDEYLAVLKYFGNQYWVRGEQTYVINSLKTDTELTYWIAIVRCSEQGISEGTKRDSRYDSGS
jgi:hypothetical protein